VSIEGREGAGMMSDWPVIGIECAICNKREFAIAPCLSIKEQQQFVLMLKRQGWKTMGLPDKEVDDEGMWSGYCRACNEGQA